MPFTSIVSWYFKKRIHQIDLFLKYPMEVQKELLLRHVEGASSTAYGKQFDLGKVRSHADFRQAVPLMHYEDLHPWVERLMDGEQNLLWPRETKWFAKSSGTTGQKSKFIPVTKEALEDCHYKGGKDLLCFYYNNNPETKLYKGKHLIVGGSATINPINNASYFGDLSAIIIKNLPFWVELRRTPTRKTALLEHWEEKIERMVEETIREDVYIVAGVPSWTLVLFKRILEKTGKENLFEVWPNLELFMHGGVNFGPYKSQFDALLKGKNMTYVQTYNASEGFFGVQDRNVADDMLLMLDYGIFYEFIPLSEYGKTDPEVVDLSQVELKQQYVLVISTNGGLWRYVIGDTIEFTSLSPFRIRVTGRTKHFINAFGEELIVDNTERAVQTACDRCNATVKEYTVAPVYMSEDETGGHEWLFEFEHHPENLDYFGEVLDNTLKTLNSDYEAKRMNNLTLRPPQLHVLKIGTFYAWLEQKGKLGGQHKVPRLSNDRTYVEELLLMDQD